ncbi:hypothetical protein GCM10017783_05290 [Deinococcus piscis]|uniref:DUF3618 domain-containing protein n=1 Tax=Deinococcus piscis TaxID=394230 RepID=A0ABQ3JZF6_9DEIO|nr:hypothetical protein [Deinococcus piscis]GHF96357.1 hypothetical protein GCM10017783_05290 [Deinococcus piscis]
MSDNRPKAEPVVLQAPSDTGTRYEEVRLPLSEKELARERLRAKVDVLTETASLKGQMQMEPLKMLGGASAVGAVLGLALGSRMKRTKKVYVDANSPAKYQKALLKAQQKEKGGDLGGALVATLVTVGARALSNKLVRDRLQHLAEDLLTKAGQEPQRSTQAGASRTTAKSALAAAPARASTAAVSSNPAVSRFLKQEPGQPSAATASAGSVGSVEASGPVRHAEVPGSTVEALADGSPIERGEMKNPNAG